MGRPRSPANIVRDDEIYARSKNGPYDLKALANDYGLTAQRVGQIIAAKDAKVYAAWRSGRYTLADLADEYQLTPEQVAELVTTRHPEFIDEKVGRGVLRSRVELLLLAIRQVVENPGYKLTSAGHLAYDPAGNPLIDVMAKIEAMRLELATIERAAKLDDRDKQQVRHSHEFYQQQADADIAQRRLEVELSMAERRELEELRRRAGQAVVQGEVVRELPPGQAEASLARSPSRAPPAMRIRASQRGTRTRIHGSGRLRGQSLTASPRCCLVLTGAQRPSPHPIRAGTRPTPRQ